MQVHDRGQSKAAAAAAAAAVTGALHRYVAVE